MSTRKAKAFSEAKQLLLTNGFECAVSLKELDDWFGVSTAHPDFSLEAILSSRLLVAHEIAEIVEVKRMGLSINEETILKSPDRIYEAHLIAFGVELALAKDLHDWRHIRTRLKDVKDWLDDPLLPLRLRHKCRALYTESREAAGETHWSESHHDARSAVRRSKRGFG